MAITRRFYVHDLVIDQYTLPGGEVFSYTRSLAKEIEREAKVLAPVRTGRLRNSISVSLHGSNQHGTNFRVTAGAGHALYVINGTRGKTLSGKHRMVLYGSHPGGWLNTRYAAYQGALVKHVDGQLPNRFMQEATRAVLVQHGLI